MKQIYSFSGDTTLSVNGLWATVRGAVSADGREVPVGLRLDNSMLGEVLPGDSVALPSGGSFRQVMISCPPGVKGTVSIQDYLPVSTRVDGVTQVVSGSRSLTYAGGRYFCGNSVNPGALRSGVGIFNGSSDYWDVDSVRLSIGGACECVVYSGYFTSMGGVVSSQLLQTKNQRFPGSPSAVDVKTFAATSDAAILAGVVGGGYAVSGRLFSTAGDVSMVNVCPLNLAPGQFVLVVAQAVSIPMGMWAEMALMGAALA